MLEFLRQAVDESLNQKNEAEPYIYSTSRQIDLWGSQGQNFAPGEGSASFFKRFNPDRNYGVACEVCLPPS